MKINEIELVGDQTFSLSTAEHYLSMASPLGVAGEFTVYYAEFDDARVAMFVDDKKQVAAYAGFHSRLNGKVWMARHAQVFPPYEGKNLMGKLYKYVKETLKKSIQSDIYQTYAGKKLWTTTLPALGLHPMIFDTKTEHIIDPKTSNINVYPGDDDSEVQRYCWILEKYDHYPEQNILRENSILSPYTGLWCKPGDNDKQKIYYENK
jgi:hypothetical protein